MADDKCRKCGRPIIWATMGRSRRVPLDARPERRAVAPRGDDLAALPAAARRVKPIPTYTMHFLTCPAGEHEGRAARQVPDE